MERVEEKLNFHHFSHEHPFLEKSNSPLKQNKTCAGCNLMILPGIDYYSCRKCSFFLHQVCYDMPRKTQHLAHPRHYLNLHALPPSQRVFNCNACGNYVAGFYYDCEECGLYYHCLCSILPFTFATSSHPHALKLSFLPPFDLSCDICNKPCYDGWLYRCHICEYDAHLCCAISNQKLLDNNQNYDNEDRELLQLVRHGFVQKSSHQVTESDIPSTISLNPSLQLSHHDDPSTLVSEDTTMTSHQFSDAYFSIDLAKSYTISPYVQKNHVRKETGHQEPKDNSEVVEENRMNEAFLIRNDTLTRKELGPEKKRKPSASENMGRSDIVNRSTKLDTERSSGSFFQTLCGCCNPGYERSI